ncbi:hypothetical protein [Crossiella sp. CA198]
MFADLDVRFIALGDTDFAPGLSPARRHQAGSAEGQAGQGG